MSTTERQIDFLQEMGLGPVWQPRGATAIAAPVAANPEASTSDTVASSDAAAATDRSAPSAAEIANMDWPQLQTAVAGCTKCSLCQSRTQTVFGVGDTRAQWLFVGEGPGRNEDAQGEPFVGQAGKLLDNMLAAIGLRRGVNAYIANVVKCRPTDANGRDRPPTPEEIAACLPYLKRQIELIQPSVMLALGKTAAIGLLQVDAATAVGKLRNQTHDYAQTPLIVTYHPAYLLRNPVDKSKAWSDLCRARTVHAAAPALSTST